LRIFATAQQRSFTWSWWNEIPLLLIFDPSSEANILEGEDHLEWAVALGNLVQQSTLLEKLCFVGLDFHLKMDVYENLEHLIMPLLLSFTSN
jgi:hypothetical protein